MAPILTLIFVIAFSMLVTKVATIALIHTGLTREQARFQSRSAFTGSGFTTAESELVMKHPVRRRIITSLMFVGNAGLVTAISSLILGFARRSDEQNHLANLGLLFGGLLFLYLITRSRRLDQLLNRVITAGLLRFTDIRVKDFSRLLTLMEGYEVAEVNVRDAAYLIGRSLAELQLSSEGILVLGIIRKNEDYVGIPRGRDIIEASDRLVVYGRSDRIGALAERDDLLEGRQEHVEMVRELARELEAQDRDPGLNQPGS